MSCAPSSSMSSLSSMPMTGLRFSGLIFCLFVALECEDSVALDVMGTGMYSKMHFSTHCTLSPIALFFPEIRLCDYLALVMKCAF